MRRPHRRAGMAASGCTAIALVLAITGIADADIGTAGLSPLAAAPGDSVQVDLHGCTYRAADVRIALARMSATGERIDAGKAVEVGSKDAGSAGEYLIIVPALDPGLYGVLAACPRDGTFGFWTSEGYLSVSGVPDTATRTPATPPATDAGSWRGLAVLAAVVLAVVAWSGRSTTDRRRRDRR